MPWNPIRNRPIGARTRLETRFGAVWTVGEAFTGSRNAEDSTEVAMAIVNIVWLAAKPGKLPHRCLCGEGSGITVISPFGSCDGRTLKWSQGAAIAVL
jgi:hypothetical protein